MNRLLGLGLSLAALIAGMIGTAATLADEADNDRPVVVKGNTEFALNLYAKVRGDGGNLVFSPVGISQALALPCAGACGQTARQVAATMHFDLPPQRFHPAFGSLLRELNGKDGPRPYELRTANALWLQQDCRLHGRFVERLQTDYGVGPQAVDFKTRAEDAARTINAWVEKQTQARIQELVRADDLQTGPQVLLTSAVYLKAPWYQQFDPAKTQPGKFAVASGRSVEVPFMHQKAEFGYYEGDQFQLLALPYWGGELRMLVFLPRAAGSLADFEKTLSPANLAEWSGRLEGHVVEVGLPKFRYTAQLQLDQTLADLGMPLAFSEEADFSGISREKLALGRVLHKTVIDVNERGTEAAAVTEVGFEATSVKVADRKLVFRADHPFLFLIEDTRTGSLLFLGRVMNPQ